MDTGLVSHYLSERERRHVQVDSVSRSAGGLSRETWFVRGPDTALVFRTDLRGGASSCPVPLTFEYEMHRRLKALALPVAAALWFEEDPALLGRAFYVRELVDGSSDVPGLGLAGREAEEMLIAASREHVRKMAQVHLVDWRSAGLGEIMDSPASAEDAALHAVRRLRKMYEDLDLPLSPLIARAFEWFTEHAPRTAPAVTLCKGSNGAMQEVWRDGEIVALSDWELASIGDPTNDWARCQGLLPVFEGRWTPRDAFEYYRELTGFEISEESLSYYKGLYWLEMSVVSLYAGRAVRSGTLLDVRLAMVETFGGHASTMQLANLIYGLELRP